MANRHATHPASPRPAFEAGDGCAGRARFSLTADASRARHRLGGVLRWDEGDGVERMLRRGVAVSMAMLLGLWPMMGTAVAAERAAAAAERTHVAALAPIRLPLE